MATCRGGIYRIVIRREGSPNAYYIGQAFDLRERRYQHLRALRLGRHDNVRMQRSFDKYGELSFSFETILICDSAKETLTLYEQAVLDFYFRTYDERCVLNVMRLCVSSHLGVKRRAETIEKMSLSQKGRKKSPEQIVAMSLMQIGRKHSPETCAKMSAFQKGIPRHPNAIAALDAVRNTTRIDALRRVLCGKPKVHSEATKKKIAATLTGRKQDSALIEKRVAPLRGRKQTPEAIANRVASRLAKAKAKKESAANGNDAGRSEICGEVAGDCFSGL